MAEHFLDFDCERTMESLKAALALGGQGGRPKKLLAADQAVGRALLKDPTIPAVEIATRLGISRPVFIGIFW